MARSRSIRPRLRTTAISWFIFTIRFGEKIESDVEFARRAPSFAAARNGRPEPLVEGKGPGRQLGRKYAEALGLAVLGPDGQPVVVTMGSYGIGVSRAVAAIAESTFDESGLCWPREVAPADIHLVAAG